MNFEEWFKHTVYTDRDCAKDAWEAGVQEGIERMQKAYQIRPRGKSIVSSCPECGLLAYKHKLDCSYGR